MKLRKILGIKKKVPAFKQVQVGNYSLLANGDHLIQDYLNQFKYYSRNLPRIAKYIESKYPVYNIIDIGANIGDTVALLRSADVNQYVYAIEGAPAYLTILNKNVAMFDKVSVFETFLGEGNQTITAAMEMHEGTGHLNNSTDQQITIQKLDDLAAANNIENVKLLKIDTDGFDFKVLRGGLSFIKQQQPILFFEYDAEFLEMQGDHPTEIFNVLHSLGYSKALFYDNFGKLLLSLSIDNIPLITQLYNYIRKKDSAFPYYDVCLFHENDDALADDIIAKEAAFYN